MIADNAIDDLPAELVVVLERHVLCAPDIDAFWDRAGALRRLLPPPRARGATDTAAVPATSPAAGPDGLLDPEVVTAVTALLADDDLDHWALREVLDDWESLWLDEEKLTGHLIRTHGQPPEPTSGMGLDDLVARHLQLHRLDP